MHLLQLEASLFLSMAVDGEPITSFLLTFLIRSSIETHTLISFGNSLLITSSLNI
jgi:hypothetical protein